MVATEKLIHIAALTKKGGKKGGSTPPAEQYVDIPGPYTFDLPALAYSYGMKYRFAVPGQVVGVRSYIGDPTGSPPAWRLKLWSATGTLLGTSIPSSLTINGFTNCYFPSPVSVEANTTYMASYFMDAAAQRVYKPGAMFTGQESGDVRALGDGEDGQQGFYVGIDGFPDTYWSGAIVPTSPIFKRLSLGDRLPR